MLNYVLISVKFLWKAEVVRPTSGKAEVKSVVSSSRLT